MPVTTFPVVIKYQLRRKVLNIGGSSNHSQPWFVGGATRGGATLHFKIIWGLAPLPSPPPPVPTTVTTVIACDNVLSSDQLPSLYLTTFPVMTSKLHPKAQLFKFIHRILAFASVLLCCLSCFISDSILQAESESELFAGDTSEWQSFTRTREIQSLALTS